ncbi:MAG: hypothetical protein AAF633_20940, partial [Chloroflexota bacterium]
SLMPKTYAKAYHTAYQAIKGLDPSAQIAVGAILQVSPARLNYLDLVLSHYKSMYGESLPADIWTFHAYILPEAYYYDSTSGAGAGIALGTDPALARLTPHRQPGIPDFTLCASENVNCAAEHDDIDQFKAQIFDMRLWMQENGYQALPLMLTEWGILYPDTITDEYGNEFTYERAAAYLDETLTILEEATDINIGLPIDGNRLVQRWSWYNAYIPDLQTLGGPSSLVYPDGRLTPVGEVYKRHIDAGSYQSDININGITGGGVILPPNAEQASISITLSLLNSGDSRTTQPTTLILTDQRSNEIGRQTIPAGMQGCGLGQIETTIELNPLEVGDYLVYAAFEGEGVADPLPDEVIPAGRVFVSREGVYLPMVWE